MRGPRLTIDGAVNGDRITPAYAGTTVALFTERYPVWDHPRVCGDHAYFLSGAMTTEGSPPRMRGPHLHTQLLL